MFIRDYCENFI